MELRGNRGEWSELYALLKLLADGQLYCGDASQNRQDDRFFPILKIFRNDQIDRTAYTVNAAKKEILVSRTNDCTIDVSQEEMQTKAHSILNVIKTHTGTFDIPEIHNFLERIDCKTIKAKSTDKADIRIVIHDLDKRQQRQHQLHLSSNQCRPFSNVGIQQVRQVWGKIQLLRRNRGKTVVYRHCPKGDPQ